MLATDEHWMYITAFESGSFKSSKRVNAARPYKPSMEVLAEKSFLFFRPKPLSSTPQASHQRSKTHKKYLASHAIIN